QGSAACGSRSARGVQYPMGCTVAPEGCRRAGRKSGRRLTQVTAAHATGAHACPEPARTELPMSRSAALFALAGLATTFGAAAQPADPAGWQFSGDLRGGWFASERSAR